MIRQLGILILLFFSLSLFADPSKAPAGPTSTSASGSAGEGAAQAGQQAMLNAQAMQAASESGDSKMKAMMMMMMMQQMMQQQADKKAQKKNEAAEKARSDGDDKKEAKVASPSPTPEQKYDTEKPTESLDMVETTLKADKSKRDAAQKAEQGSGMVDSSLPLPQSTPLPEFDLNKYVVKKEAPAPAEAAAPLPTPGKTTPEAIARPDSKADTLTVQSNGGLPAGTSPIIAAQIAKPLSVGDLGQLSKNLEELTDHPKRGGINKTQDEPGDGNGGSSKDEDDSGSKAIESFFDNLNSQMESGPQEGAYAEELIEMQSERRPNVFQIAQGVYHYAAYTEKRVNLKPKRTAEAETQAPTATMARNP